MTAKKSYLHNHGLLFVIAMLFVGGLVYLNSTMNSAKPRGVVEGASSGFDQFGYNNTARNFNGTGSSWCMAKGLSADCMGNYSNDKLIMKWTADWDRGNAEGWSKPPYDGAWTDNEWNGMGKNGSGAVWHYKIKWVGACGADNTVLPDGGYCIWGQFETVMDQGKDPSIGPGHIWNAKANPAGYGSK